MLVFQSSPGAKAGCYSCSLSGTTRTARFNPHPARRPGATRTPYHPLLYDEGFNPHPARRPGATRCDVGVRGSVYLVSILTRREGRVLLDDGGYYGAIYCVSMRQHPPSPLGDRYGGYYGAIYCVSLLTRRDGRVLRGGSGAGWVRPLLFQSSPGAKAGCYVLRCTLAHAEFRLLFRSSPGAKAGCYYAPGRPTSQAT